MLLRCLALAAIFLLMPSCAFAQAPVRLGILVQDMGRAQSQAIKGLNEELYRLGYGSRKNLVSNIHNVKGNRAALPSAVNDLIDQRPSLIFTTGTSATRVAATATRKIPIVFVHPGNPVVSGLFKSIELRPANLTGVAAYADEATETGLAFLKKILPGLHKIVVFFDANNAGSRENFERAKRSAKKFKLEVAAYAVKSADELRTTIANLRPEKDAAIFQVADELVESETEFLFRTARAKKIPTMFNEESWVIKGALAAYGPSYYEMGRQAAGLGAKIFRGEPPASLPIERATKFDLTLNYRTSSFIGLRFPPDLLKKANKVIR